MSENIQLYLIMSCVQSTTYCVIYTDKVRNMNIKRIKDTLRCSAEGYPEPNIKWVKVSSENSSYTHEVVKECQHTAYCDINLVGHQSTDVLQCLAENIIRNQTYNVSSEITLTNAEGDF